MGRFRAVLLDIDGTLLDSNDHHALAWQEVLDAHGHQVPFERVRALIGKGGDKLLPEVTGIAEDTPEGKAIAEERVALFLQRYLPQVKPLAGVRELLEKLGAQGYLRVIATSASRAELEKLIERANIADLVDAQTSSDDADRSKPDPDIVRAALEKAGVSAHEAVLLGDTPYDRDAAQRAGVAFIGVRAGGWDDASLKGALAVYRDPSELVARFDASPLV